MSDAFGFDRPNLESPLTTGQLANFSSGNYDFPILPRALNCSAAGTLVVDMGSLTNQAIAVVAGLNPYRVTRIYNSGSTAMAVVGMW
jgi:hypothetical protein